MDTLRAGHVASMLSCSDGNESKKVVQQQQCDKDKLARLIKGFGELSKHERILFLINIREFTRDGGSNNGGLCNGVIIKQEEESSSTPTSAGTPSTSTPTCTPQAQRLSRTSNWLQKTFIQDSQVALPKEEVYSLYKTEFTRTGEKAISTADFGKLMRQVFPDVKARRLGQRGQSKYCYANIRKRSEIERPALPTPLPQNELITWAKNKFNIDFSEVTQVVSYLKCDSGANVGRKRRASCGGNLLKQRSKNATRSASVSVLELEQKEDPLMILHDNESLEIGSYFQETSVSTQWPQLRSLLTEDSNSSFSGNFSSSNSGILTGNSSKKKRHSSSVQFEFIKPELQGTALLHRSASVPVPGNSGLDDELQSLSTSSIFDELSGTVNPLFSSVQVTSSFKPTQPVSSTSSASSSNSSAMFESIDVNIGGGSIGLGVGVGSDLQNGLINGGHGSDVFFDSVFDLMMSDCQN